MKKRKILPLFVILIIFSSTILFGILIYSQTNNNQEYSYNPNNTFVEFNNFSSFQILYDEQGLSSVKSNSHINFTYSGGSTGFYLMRYYYLNLTDYGNCFDFDMQITIDYNYTGSIHFGKFELILGSYYNELGEYCGEPNGTIVGNPCAPAKPLCKSNVVDAWTGFGGEFRVFAWPNDILEKYITAHGVPGSSGSATFYMNRVDDIIYCQVNQSNSITIDHIWTEEVTKPMNFILIGESIYVETTNFASASFYDFSASLNYTEIPTTSPTETSTDPFATVFSFTIISTILGLSLLIILKRKLKKYVS